MYNATLINTLISAGLTKLEADIYLLLISNKNLSVTEIAKKLNTHRARIYEAFKSLSNYQLIQRENNYSKTLEVQPPTQILSLLRQKEAEIKLQAEKIESVIPEIMYKYNKNDKHPRISTFEGIGQMSKVQLQHIEEVEEETLWLNIGQEINTLFDERFFYLISPQKRSLKGVKTRILANQNNVTMRKYKEYDKNHKREVKYLPENYKSKNTTTIYNDKIILWNTYVPRAIIIYDTQLAQSQKDLFNLMWGLLP